jgi:hypothetical protein
LIERFISPLVSYVDDDASPTRVEMANAFWALEAIRVACMAFRAFVSHDTLNDTKLKERDLLAYVVAETTAQRQLTTIFLRLFLVSRGHFFTTSLLRRLISD